MSVLDSVRTTYPQVAEQVETLQKFLYEWRAALNRDFLLSQGIPGSVIEEIVSDVTPPGGIYGVGATVFGAGEEVRAAVFVTPGLGGAPMEPIDVKDVPVGWLPGAPAEMQGLVAVALPMPEEQAGLVAVGGELTSLGRVGRCGLEVVTTSRQRAVLTAGHFVRTCYVDIEAGGARVGEGVHTNYLALHQPQDLVADVALVELDSGVSVSNPWPVAGPGTGKQLDNIVSYGKHGPQTGWVRSVVTSFSLQQNIGRWGEILITDRAISRGGDSGSPVYLKDNSGVAIGHVVAGAFPAYSLVQDINYLMHSIPGGVTLA